MAEHIIQGSTLTAIADAIREKASVSGSLYPKDMPNHIRSIQSSGGYPDYVIQESNAVAQTVNTRRSTISNPFTFLVMTDMHEMGSRDSTNTERTKNHRANLNAGQGAKLISDKVPLDFFANLGDLSWSSDNKENGTIALDTVYSIGRARGYTAAVEEDNVSFILRGNHDVESKDGFIDSDYVTDVTGNYGYHDFTNKKVRVIYLNTADNSVSDTDHNVSDTQLQWFCEALDLTKTYSSNASSWNVIILSHHPAGTGLGIPSIADCLYAYLNGTNFTYKSVSYNFANKNLATVVAQFHGHVHCYKVGRITTSSGIETSIPRIAIPNACHTRNNEYGTYQNDLVYGQSSSETVNKVDKTAKNTAFNVVTIDFVNNRIYADIYGAGENRAIDYKSGTSVAICSITTNLTNTTFNGVSSVELGASYTATVSANDGCKLSSVKVVMNGTDITSSVYSNGRINISSVTGNIVITASATRVEFTKFKIERTTTNVVTGSTTEVLEDSSYTETITSISGADKALEVYVTMNGADVTSSLNADGTPMYCNGKIDIKKVTGNIHIKAIGYEFENLVRTSEELSSTNPYNVIGYKNNYRVSETQSAGFEGQKDGYVTVGWIPYSWNSSNSIYVKGASISTTDDYIRFYGFRSGKSSISSNGYINGSRIPTYFVYEELGDNYYKLTPISTIADIAYLRISLIGTGENLIITINEPIVSSDSGGNEPDEPNEPEVNVITITQHPQDINVVVGEEATFNVKATATIDSNLSYQWQEQSDSANPNNDNDWTNVIGGTVSSNGESYSMRYSSISSSPYVIKYRCVVSDSNGNKVASNYATLTITEKEVVSGYTNLVPTSTTTDGVTVYGEDYNGDGVADGYKKGAYVSSSGTYGTDANCVATGCIYLDTDVEAIYIKGAELRTSGTSANHVRLYAGSIDTTHSYTAHGDGSSGWTFDSYFNVETLGTNYYKLTLNNTALQYFRGRYYRVSLIDKGEELIITHDEPITN